MAEPERDEGLPLDHVTTERVLQAYAVAVALARKAKVDPPCVVDYRRTGRQWTDPAPPLDRPTIKEMTALCHSCPIRWDCYREGKKAGPLADGVWGGYFWRKGKPIDPHQTGGKRRSMYLGVSWENDRGEGGQWKAFAYTDGKYRHLGYFDLEDEDEAGAVVRDFKERHESG